MIVQENLFIRRPPHPPKLCSTLLAGLTPLGVRTTQRSNRRVAERVRRAIATLEPDLMCPVSVREAHPVVLCQLEAATRVRICHDFGARHSVGIELVVPRRVE